MNCDRRNIKSGDLRQDGLESSQDTRELIRLNLVGGSSFICKKGLGVSLASAWLNVFRLWDVLSLVLVQRPRCISAWQM